MKFGTYLMLNVLLVGGGILIYDTVRVERHETSRSADVASIEHATDPAASSASAESPIVLAGGGEAAVLAQFQEFNRRIAILEQARRGTPGGASAGTAHGTSAGGASDGGGVADPGEGLSLPDIGDPNDPRFDPVILERFRVYKDKVEQMEREKRAIEFANTRIEGLRLNLSSAQQEAVVAATVKYESQVRDTVRSLPRGARGPEERQKAVGELKEQYTKTIASIVPAGDAEKIVNSVTGIGGGGDQGGRPGGRIRGLGGNPQGGQTPR